MKKIRIEKVRCNDDFKVGDRVWDVVKGEGVIDSTESENKEYPIRVKFICNDLWVYTREGRFLVGDLLPSLYKYPVKIVEKEVKND